MKMRLSISCLALLLISSLRAQYRVSEIYIPDDDGEPGWIEVNSKGQAESIDGYRLVVEDSKDKKIQWAFPPHATTGEDGRLVVYCVGEEGIVDGTVFAGFRLPKAGGTVRLLKEGSAEPVSEANLPGAWGAFSWGTKEGEAPEAWGYFLNPSPGKPNGGIWEPSPPAGAVRASSGGQLFSGNLKVSLSTNDERGKVRYTLDGKRPSDAKAKDYAGPITLKSSTMLRACVVEKGKLPGQVWGAGFVRTDPALLAEFSSNLPLLVIDSHGVAVDEEWNPGQARPFRTASAFCFDVPVNGDGRSRLSAVADFIGRAGVHVRGHSSASFPKMQYALEFRDERDEDVNVRILDFPKESDFVLQGPYADRSLVRNVLAYETAREIGGSSAGVRTRFVELFFNQDGGDLTRDDYRGVYVLMEKIKRDDKRVPLKKLRDWDTEPETVSGGYLFKNDRGMKGTIIRLEHSRKRLEMVYPSEPNTVQSAYLTRYLNDYEDALQNGTREVNGDFQSYRSFIDRDSFIVNHILGEFFRNIDALESSCYYHKDRNLPIRALPIWDYNYSMGNVNFRGGASVLGWQTFKPGDAVKSIMAAGGWYGWLGFDEDAVMDYWDRYFQMREGPLSDKTLAAKLDSYSTLLAESQERNFEKWPVRASAAPGAQGGAGMLSTHSAELHRLKEWLVRRGRWMDTEYPRPPEITLMEGQIGVKAHAPSGFAGKVYYTIDGSDPRLRRSERLETRVSLVSESSPCRVFLPSKDTKAPGKAWHADKLESDSLWIPYGSQSKIDTVKHSKGAGASLDGGPERLFVWQRVEFELGTAPGETSRNHRFRISTGSGMEFQAYLNGTRIHVRTNQRKTGPGEQYMVELVELDNPGSKLQTGTNVLAILWSGVTDGSSPSNWSVNLDLVGAKEIAPNTRLLEGSHLPESAEGTHFRMRGFDGKRWTALRDFIVP